MLKRSRKCKFAQNLHFLHPNFLLSLPKIIALRVCLFGGEIERMKNFGEKIGRKTFLECVWLGREEGK